MEGKEYQITVRQIREILFHLEDQSMTVSDLRSMLFNIEEQDAQIKINFAMWRAAEEKNKKRK